MGINIKNKLSTHLSAVLSVSADKLLSLIEIPPDPLFGDFAVPCFSFARDTENPPAHIASEFELLFSKKSQNSEIIQDVRAQGPYLNLFLNKGYIVREITRDIVRSQFETLHEYGKGRIVVIDYSSPNIAKPFGVGHLRSTVIGSSLKKIFTFLGYKVIGVNHLGDWGTQFGKLITAFKRWGDESELKSDTIKYLYNLYVKFHSEAAKDTALEDEARMWFNRLENKDPEAMILWERFKDHSLAEFKKIYERLGVEFEHYTGESFYSSMLDAAIEKAKACGITDESEGALIVPLNEDMPPALLKKSDDSTLYFTRDIAAALYRHRTFNFDIALYVVGSPQALHFKQLFKVIKAMGISWYKNCHHVPFGQVRFEDRSMSTRQGNVVFLEEVLDKAVKLALGIIQEKNPALQNKENIAEAVGVGSIIFNDLKNNRIKNITFKWDEILNFSGETGPYLQYTYARSNSLLKKFKEKYGEVEFKKDLPWGDEGYSVCLLINDFEDTVMRASKEFEPSIISRYLLDIASQFNSFYNSHRVITDDSSLSLARALIVKGVNKVLKQGLTLLGINPVNEM